MQQDHAQKLEASVLLLVSAFCDYDQVGLAASAVLHYLCTTSAGLPYGTASVQLSACVGIV